MTDETASTHAPRTTVSMLTLSSFVVGSMVGAGVFSLPGTFAAQTGVVGSLVAWLVAGAGMFLLALVFQRLASATGAGCRGLLLRARGFRPLRRVPLRVRLLGECAGNVFYWVLIMSTVGAVVPALGDGDTPSPSPSRR
jgi:arginine:ornithine antiporter/lysine permease